jgi:hypothetical protein
MTYRVIQWATGPVGRSSLRHILDSPDCELVGVYVHSPEKEGVDAGALIGRPDTGVKATTDRQAILAIDADVVVFTARMYLDLKDLDDEVLPILRSGKNVVTPVGYWNPAVYGTDYTNAIEGACREGNSTLFGGGENPGFFLPRLAETLTYVVSEVRSIGLTEMCDLTHAQQELIFAIGMGQPPSAFKDDAIVVQMLERNFNEEIMLVASQLGTSVDRYEVTSKYAVLDHDIEIDAGTIKAGTVVAQNHRHAAILDDREIITVNNTWFIHRDVPGWKLHDDRWTVTVDGRPSLTVDIDPSTSLSDTSTTTYADTNSGVMATMTAAAVCNAIPQVCAAKPGIFLSGTPDAPKVRWVK